MPISSYNGVPWVSSVSPYVYYSTFGDGNDYCHRETDLTDNSDSKSGLCSFWIKMSAGSSDTTAYTIYNNTTGYVIIHRSTTGTIHIECTNTNGNLRVSMDSDANSIIKAASPEIAGQGWFHVLAAWDITPSTPDRRAIWICPAGGSWDDQTNVTTFTEDATYNIDYTRADHGIFGTTTGSSALVGGLCEVYIHFGSWIDITDSAVRALFNTSGKPANIPANIASTALPTPIMYFNKEYSTFQTNAGSGGGFTEGGAFIDGGADIP